VPHGQIEGESVPLKRLIDRRSVAKVVCVLALWACTWPASADEKYGAPPPELRLHLDRLVRSYPDWIAGADDQNVILKNGARLPISDHRTDKSFDELLEHPDIDDRFYAPYPVGSAPKPPPRNADPGRVRYEPLFIAMYGDCRKNEVVPKLKTVEWLPAHNGGRVAITAMNGVDQALGAVSRALDQLPSEFMKFLVPTAGTYNCRSVAGSSARSMHAYGAAIDLNVTHADYWRWSKNASAPIWENRISIEIVRTFEQHGFIWGGYWYHFDTMHFEYRPELLPDEPMRH
jgi:D-alanyl-D-alanine carboxypeptidase-like protein